MRKGWLLLALLSTIAVLVSCGTNYITEGGGGTPTPSPQPTTSPPPLAGFSSGMQPLMLSNGCGRNGTVGGLNCHNQQGFQTNGTFMVFGTGAGATLTAGQVTSNWKMATCINQITSYNPPGGKMWTYFCSSSTASNGNSTHQSLVAGTSRTAFSNSDCATWYNYLTQGATGSNIRTCQ